MAFFKFTGGVLIFAYISSVFGGRIFMDSCSRNGFLCEYHDGLVGAVFECDDTYTTQDVEIWIYHLRAIYNLTALTIKNCDHVKIYMKCSHQYSQLEYLKLANIKNLTFIPDRYTQNPTKIQIDNITWIEEIPYNTFNQISRRWTIGDCSVPKTDLESITMRNVTIGNIRADAFFYLEEIKELYFNSIRVKMMETDAMHVTLAKGSKFLSHDTIYEKIEPGAMLIFGRKMIAATNDFIGITSISNNSLCFQTLKFSEEK